MTGRKPEGGEKRKTFSCSTYELQQYKDPSVFLKLVLLFLYLPIAVWNELRGTLVLFFFFFLQLIPPHSVQGINTQEWLSQLARAAYTLTVSLSFPPGFALVFFSFLRFSGGNLFPLLSSPKSFPSASDYLWLQLVSRQPSGPVWRLCSLLSPQTALRVGGRGSGGGGVVVWWWCGGGRDMSELGGQTLLEDSKGWVLADTAIQSQETQVKEKGTHENVTPVLIVAQVCFCKRGLWVWGSHFPLLL